MQDIDDTLTWYLKEIDKTPLLSPDEEKRITRLVQNGDEKARETLIKSNLKFVVFVAKKHYGKGVPLSDLISEGNIGLMKAVEKYDPDSGVRFISYAVNWIKQTILKKLDERIICIPGNKKKNVAMIKNAERSIELKTDRKATLSEIADATDMDVNIVGILLRAGDIASLDAPAHRGMHKYTIVDTIPSNDPPFEDEVDNRMISDVINKLMQCLNEREFGILEMKYGLNGLGEHTLSEVGLRFGISRERVRQIASLSLRKLRCNTECENVKNLIEGLKNA